jgi:hypothetical protein
MVHHSEMKSSGMCMILNIFTMMDQTDFTSTALIIKLQLRKGRLHLFHLQHNCSRMSTSLGHSVTFSGHSRPMASVVSIRQLPHCIIVFCKFIIAFFFCCCFHDIHYMPVLPLPPVSPPNEQWLGLRILSRVTLLATISR